MTAGIVTALAPDDITDDTVLSSFWLQVGTGTGQTLSDTVLAEPVGTRIQTVNVQATDTHTNDIMRLTATFTAEEVTVVSEVGVFDTEVSPNMLYYSDQFAPISLAIGDAIVFQVNVTLVIAGS